jgi:DNA polymerase III alpha subunit
MIARGDTMGVFYVESPAMRLLQKKTGKGDFAHLVIHSSIIRPAANRYIEEYIERLKGKPWQPLHPVLGQLFAETYGIMCYQEDVSKVAIALAGFSSSDADAIRKVLTKKDREHRLAMWKQRFFEGAAARGVSLSVIEAVWDMIMSFSGYSFVKAHSASYAMLSFQSAWLRAHYPAEFMAGVLSNHGGFYSTLAYASEARRIGLTLLPPEVNESAIRCKGRGTIIRWGLGMIAGLSTGTLHALIAAREGGNTKNCADARAEQPFRPFVSLQDFAARVPFSREEAEVFVGSGSLDTIAHNLSRPRILMEMLRAVKDRSQKIVADLFATESSSTLNFTDSFRSNAAVSPRRNAIAQMRWLGTTLSCHPLSLVPGALEMPRVKASELSAHVGVLVRLIGWLITAKEVLTAHDEPMEFLTFEDETAIFETVLFPAAYTKFRPLLLEGGAFVVEGTVEESHHAITLTIVHLRRLPAIPKLNETRHVLSPSGFNAWRRDW